MLPQVTTLHTHNIVCANPDKITCSHIQVRRYQQLPSPPISSTTMTLQTRSHAEGIRLRPTRRPRLALALALMACACGLRAHSLRPNLGRLNAVVVTILPTDLPTYSTTASRGYNVDSIWSSLVKARLFRPMISDTGQPCIYPSFVPRTVSSPPSFSLTRDSKEPSAAPLADDAKPAVQCLNTTQFTPVFNSPGCFHPIIDRERQDLLPSLCSTVVSLGGSTKLRSSSNTYYGRWFSLRANTIFSFLFFHRKGRCDALHV